MASVGALAGHDLNKPALLKAAEHLEAWARTHEDLGEKEEARGVLRASGYLMELADELGKKADVGVGDLT